MSSPPAAIAAATAAPATSTTLIKPTVRISNFIRDTAKAAFFSSDVGIIIFFLGIFLVAGLGIVILFENAVPGMRSQLLTNFIGIGLGIVFIMVVFNQMGKTIDIVGHKIDVGMLYYLAILIVVMLIFSN